MTVRSTLLLEMLCNRMQCSLRELGTDRFREVRFGGEANATYGLDVGDLDGDRFPDIVGRQFGCTELYLSQPIHQTNRAIRMIALRPLDRAMMLFMLFVTGFANQ